MREEQALPDENNDAASIHDITRENARLGAVAIRMQSRELRNLERGRSVKIGFLDPDKINRMGQKKVFSAPGPKTANIPLKNHERVRGGREEAGDIEGQLGARSGGEGAEGENTKWAEGK